MPYVTNHRYRLHWEAGLDFEKMYLQMSERWEETDLNTFLVFNFTAAREAVNITTNLGRGDQIPEGGLLTKSTNELVSGDYWFRNETDPREFEIVVNGKESGNADLFVEPLQCISGVCELELVEDVELEEG